MPVRFTVCGVKNAGRNMIGPDQSCHNKLDSRSDSGSDAKLRLDANTWEADRCVTTDLPYRTYT